MKRKLQVFLRDIFLPLFVGLCTYLLFYKGTYINSALGVESDFTFNSSLVVFVKSWLCDILWAYAMTYALYLALFAFKHKILFSAIISICVATVFELFQLFGCVDGTFDILDIVFQFLAVFFAVIIIKRREKT